MQGFFFSLINTVLTIGIIFSFPSLKATSRGPIDSVLRTPLCHLPSFLSCHCPLSRLLLGHTQSCGLHCVHQKDMFKFWPLVLAVGTLFGNRVFVTKLTWWMRVCPNSMTGVFIRTGKFGARDTKGEGHVRMKAELGMLCLQAKKYQWWLTPTVS